MNAVADRIAIHDGDCLDVLPTLAADSIDACVCDPPYNLISINKRFGQDGSTAAQYGVDGRFQRLSGGFMGAKWDSTGIAFRPEVWREVYRVLKPGAFLLAFGGTRTYHRMACAIEDAGFEIRDTIMWVYGSGFPKSHDVSKGIDRAAGAERPIIGKKTYGPDDFERSEIVRQAPRGTLNVTAPATDAARQWQGFGTALKPACEMICLARKPLSEGTVAANVVRWGTGAINIDGCRVSGEPWEAHSATGLATVKFFSEGDNPIIDKVPHDLGRWPANLIHDGSEEVLAGFPETQTNAGQGPYSKNSTVNVFGEFNNEGKIRGNGADSGSAARFFYTAKADSDDRLGSKHPTVKPLDLMQYLVRLVCPPGGTVLDCFAGTGTTGEAAFREGMRAVLIEREKEYQADIRRRMELLMAGPDQRAYAAAKERLKDKPRDDGPLFGGSTE